MSLKRLHHFEYPAIGASPANTVVQLTQNLIRFPSLTPITSKLSEASFRILNYIEGYLARHGANCQRLIFDGGHHKWSYPVDNLYAK